VEREYTNRFVFTIRFWAGSKAGDRGDDAFFEILSMLRLPVPPS
jgi:hypothetical protein